MGLWLSIDHGITSGMMEFEAEITALYDNPDDNPFQRESSANKTLVFADDALADALRALTGDAAAVFEQSGVGGNVQRGSHPNFGSFQQAYTAPSYVSI